VGMVFLGSLGTGSSVNAENTYRPKTPQKYILGPRGGCYYINENGNKTYVDRDLCKKD
jgi:hypothetical protein